MADQKVAEAMSSHPEAAVLVERSSRALKKGEGKPGLVHSQQGMQALEEANPKVEGHQKEAGARPSAEYSLAALEVLREVVVASRKAEHRSSPTTSGSLALEEHRSAEPASRSPGSEQAANR